MKLADIKLAIQHYPFAPRRQAIQQAVSLAKAKDYLIERGIYAIKDREQNFKYKAVTL